MLDANQNLTTYGYDAFNRLAMTEFPVKALSASASDPTDVETYDYE